MYIVSVDFRWCTIVHSFIFLSHFQKRSQLNRHWILFYDVNISHPFCFAARRSTLRSSSICVMLEHVSRYSNNHKNNIAKPSKHIHLCFCKLKSTSLFCALDVYLYRSPALSLFSFSLFLLLFHPVSLTVSLSFCALPVVLFFKRTAIWLYFHSMVHINSKRV